MTTVYTRANVQNRCANLSAPSLPVQVAVNGRPLRAIPPLPPSLILAMLADEPRTPHRSEVAVTSGPGPVSIARDRREELIIPTLRSPLS